MKSIAISTQDALKDIYPNLAEVTSSGVNASKNILTSIKQNSGGAENLANSLKNNKYVKYASKAYSNALADLKSGNFNNTDRFMGGDEGFDQMFAGLDDSSSSDISFGDEDTGATNNVSFNYVNKGNNDAVLAFQEQSQKQSEAFIKTNKASMDAQIAVASASMYQIEKLGSIELSAKAGESGKLFGTITTKKLCEELKERAGIVVRRKAVSLNAPINRIGEFTMLIKLTSKVKSELKVIVTASEVVKESVEEVEETEA